MNDGRIDSVRDAWALVTRFTMPVDPVSSRPKVPDTWPAGAAVRVLAEFETEREFQMDQIPSADHQPCDPRLSGQRRSWATCRPPLLSRMVMSASGPRADPGVPMMTMLP